MPSMPGGRVITPLQRGQWIGALDIGRVSPSTPAVATGSGPFYHDGITTAVRAYAAAHRRVDQGLRLLPGAGRAHAHRPARGGVRPAGAQRLRQIDRAAAAHGLPEADARRGLDQ